MDKNEKIKSLDKQIKDMGSTIMKQEEYSEDLKGRIKVLEKTEKDIKAKIPTLEEEIKKGKQELFDYKKICLSEIVQKQTALRIQGEQIKSQNSDSDTRVKELNILSIQLHAEADRLTKDKKDFSTQQWNLQEQFALLRTKESNLFEEAEANNKYSKRLAEIESSLDKQQGRVENQLNNISIQLAEIFEGRKTNALKVLEFNVQQWGLNQQKIEQGKKEIYLKSETEKLNTLCNDWNERLKEMKRKEESYNKSLKVLKDYEDELELKRLTLLSEARKKDIKMKIEKLK